jgi:hypothetical protein
MGFGEREDKGGSNKVYNNMRYRDQVVNKVEVLESTLKSLRQIVQRQEPVNRYIETIERAEEQLNQIKQYVEMEPRTSNEVGGFSNER